MNLRDHDRECVHGERLSHPVLSEGVQIGDIVCPGGAAVDIDYEAAVSFLTDTYGVHPPMRTIEGWAATLPGIVDAALGITDE